MSAQSRSRTTARFVFPFFAAACLVLPGCAGGSTALKSTTPLVTTIAQDVPLSSGAAVAIPLLAGATLSGTIGSVPAGDILHIVQSKTTADATGNFAFVAVVTPTADTQVQALNGLRPSSGIPGYACATVLGGDAATAALATVGRWCFDNNGARDVTAQYALTSLATAMLHAGQAYTIELDLTVNAPAG